MLNELLCIVLICGFCRGLKCSVFINKDYPVIETNSGTIAGKYIKVLNREIASYQGIPFAKPPLGEKRFNKPDPIDKWNGTLLAKEKPPACMQYSSRNYSWLPNDLNKSEDCLYLNIWAPPQNNCSGHSEKLPVMVWIHGGGFFFGSSSMELYDGRTLAALEEVIVVSMNYRLGIFGFLNGGVKEASGNAGLYDQLLALKWVNANIEKFSGDAKRITLFGQSVGGISTSLHIFSPLSRSLFQKAIIESGTFYKIGIFDDNHTSILKTNAIAEAVGCSNESSNLMNNPSEVINCLKQKDSLELAKAEDVHTSKNPIYFGPVLGSTCDGCDEFLPYTSNEVSFSNKIEIPILLGFNKNEASFGLNYVLPQIFPTDKNPIINLTQAKDVMKFLFSGEPQISFQELFNFYFRNLEEYDTDRIVQAISNAYGDYTYNCPSFYFAEKAEENYFYYMTHRSLKDDNAEWMGTTHSYEVPYVFGLPVLHHQDYTVEDQIFSLNLMMKWVAFAKNGYPLRKESNQTWPKFSSTDPIVYELNPRREGPLLFPRKEACEFWRKYLTK